MTHPATDTTETTTAARQVAVDDLRVHISTALTALGRHINAVHALVATRSRGLGFLTHEGKAAMDRQVIAERADRYWNLVNAGGVKITGEVPAPGSIPALQYLAETHTGLAHLVRRIVTAATRAGVCPIPRLAGEPTIPALIARLRELSWRVNNLDLLTETLHDLENLTHHATSLLEGNDKTRLDEPCPHCGRPTLVVYFRDGVIRCDRDPHTGLYEPCACPDPMCDCHTNPHHRHQWYRDLGTGPHGWWRLADRLNLTRHTSGAPPMTDVTDHRATLDALAALTRSINLLPLDEALDTVARAEALGPILDPTAFLHGGINNLQDQRELIEAALGLQRAAGRIAERAEATR